METSAGPYRKAWGGYPTGLSVVTTRQPDGGVYGMTAAKVVFGTCEPPIVVIFLGRQRQTHANIERDGRFGLSILSGEQASWADYCSRPPEARGPVLPGRFRFSERSTAIIEGSLAFMDCRVVARYEAGGHVVLFVGEVDGLEVSEGYPLLFHRGEYLSVG